MNNRFLFVLVFSCFLLTACSEKEKEIIVESIAISQPSAEMTIGETISLKATISPSNASYDGITWTSTNPGVASVSNMGLVTALSEGNTTITAMAGGKTANCLIAVMKNTIAVSSISLDLETIEMLEGDTKVLTATVKPDDATEKTVSWKSSNTDIVTVESNGTVTAVKEGEASVTASAGDKTTSCRVIVKKRIPVQSIALDVAELSMKVGETTTLIATISPATASNKTVEWKSDATSIASVSSEGVVSALSSGQAKITVTTSDGGYSASCIVMVCLLGDGFQLGHEYVDLGLPSGLKWATTNVGANSPEEYGDYFAWGETRAKTDYTWLSYLLCYGSDVRLIKYVNDNEYGAYIDNLTELEDIDDAAHINWKGGWRMPNQIEFQELKDGCSWISTTQSGVKGYTGTSRYNGKTIFFPAAAHKEGTYNSGTSIDYWSSTLRDNKASSGVMICIDKMYPASPLDRCYGLPVRAVTEVSSIVPITGIALDDSAISLNVGEKKTLSYSVIPSNASNKTVFWDSSSKKVASVSSHGVVCALESGTSQITAKTADGEYVATVSITVSGQKEINGHEWVDLGLPSGLKWATCNIGASSPEQFGDRFAWGETSPKAKYDSASYKWYRKESNGYKLTKYCTVSYDGPTDMKRILDPEDDAAHVNWKGSWRMPTYDDVVELLKSCTWTWTTMNGVNGYKVTSKTNTNSIFLPASGWYNHNVSLIYYQIGSQCALWTSSLGKNGSRLAYSIENSSSTTTHEREHGLTVRPVSE